MKVLFTHLDLKAFNSKGMKKLLLLLLLVIVGLIGSSQIYTYTPPVDTLTNADTVLFTLPTTVSETHVAAFAVTSDTISGTATVTATLQEYVETGKWVDVASATTLINAGDVAEKSHVFKLTDTPSLGYRVRLIQSGTASTHVSGKFVFKRKGGI